MITEVILPVLGETMSEGTIVEWCKQEGDAVRRGEHLFSIESDKATLEVESPADGVLRRILVPVGATVPVLTVVGLITSTADEPLQEPPALPFGEPARLQVEDLPAPGSPAPSSPLRSAPGGRVLASPRARKLAREKGVSLAGIVGTGPGGRIVERDVATLLESVPKATPVARRVAEGAGVDLRTVAGSGPGGRITRIDVEEAMAAVGPGPEAALPPEAAAQVPMSTIRAVIARRMVEGHSVTAPVTLTMEVDATTLVGLRGRLKASLAHELGFDLGYNDLLIKIVARALREFPYMNARLDGDAVRLEDRVHVALAVDTERGLLAPVIRDADRKGLAELARELRQVAERARAGKAPPDELTGSTFTITNLGMYEVDVFTPIINLPEVAILGVGRIRARPAVVDGELCVRQMMWLSLTFDHRLVDGAPASRFLQRLKQLIEEPHLLLA